MKRIAQFRFEGFNSPNNYPNFSDYNAMLTTGNIFHDYRLISKFGIQAPVGMKFYLNNSITPISIGKTGIYELDLENVGRIFAIRFDSKDISDFFPANNQSNRLLIDIVYDGGTEA